MSSLRSFTVLPQPSLASLPSISPTQLGACGVSITITTQASHLKVCLRCRRNWHQRNKLCLLLCIDVELALGSARVVQQAPSSIASFEIVPTHNRNDVQAFANQVNPSVSPQPLGSLTNSTADSEFVEGRNDSQDAASSGIALDAAVAPTLQPLQQPEPPDVVPVQETTSNHAIANPVDPSVSCSALNHPDIPACSSTPSHSTDGC